MSYLIHRLIAALWRRLSFALVPLVCRIHHVRVRARGIFVGEPMIRNQGEIQIGDDCLLVSSPTGNPLWCLRPCILHTERKGKITIGSGFKASGCCLVAKDSIVIGNNVLLGANVTIIDNDMHNVFDTDARGAIAESQSAAVEIEDNVWVGANVFILKGTKIGRNSIIGAGVAVRKDIPPHSIVVSSANIIKPAAASARDK